MLTIDNDPVSCRKPVGIYWAFGGLGVVLYLLILYSLQLGSLVAGQHAILVDALKNMRYETTYAHLLLERKYAGEKTLLETPLLNSRKRSVELNRILLNGGVYDGVRVPALEDKELQGRLYEVRHLQEDFYDLLEDFWVSISDLNSDSDDSHFAAISSVKYDQLMLLMEGVERRMKLVIDSKHRTFRSVQYGLMAFILVCAVGAAWLMWVFVHRLEQQNRRLGASKERTRMLLENAQDLILLVDVVSHEVVDVNVEACEVLGYTREELIGKSLHLIEVDGKLEQYKQSRYSDPSAGSFLVETEFAKKDGSVFPVEANLGYVSLQNRIYWLGVVRDISERKRMETELIDAKHQAEAANRMKSEFMDKMSHEIRTPINGVMGVLQLLETTPLDREQVEYVDMGLQSCVALTSLVGNILELSSMESDSVQVWNESLYLMEMVAAVEATFAEQVAKKGLRFKVDFDDRIPDELVGDSKRIDHLLKALVDNATKFTSEGEIELKVAPTTGPSDSDSSQFWCRFEVNDTGPGISEDKLETIFEPFQQGDNSCTRRFEGAGLGLSVVTKFVEVLGGTVSVTSQLGEGSCFVVELPFEIRGEHRKDIGHLEASNAADSASGSVPESVMAESKKKTGMPLPEVLGKMGIKMPTNLLQFRKIRLAESFKEQPSREWIMRSKISKAQF